MAIAPPDNVTITITGATAVISGNMSGWTVAPGLRLYPGSNAGTEGPSREIATYTQNGTTGATITFTKAFTANYSNANFYIMEGAPSGTAAYMVNQLQRMLSYFLSIFGADLSIDSTSQQVPVRRGSGGTFARFAFYLGLPSSVLTFFLTQRTVGAREVLTIQASPDGTQLVDGFEMDRANGTVHFRAAEGAIASASVCDLGSIRDRRVAITGSTTINSLGSVPHQEKIVRFAAALTLVQSASLDLRNGGQNITVLSGSTALMVSDAAGNWSMVGYWPAQVGRSMVLTGTHTTTNPDTASRGFSSGDTTAVSGTLTGFHYSTSIRDLATHGVQLALADTADAVFVRRLTGGTWLPWRQIAEFGTTNAATFGRLQVGGMTTPTLFHSLQHNARVLNVRGDAASFGYSMSGIVLQAASSTQGATENIILTGTNIYVGTNLAPTSDNAFALGLPSQRWSTIYAGTGTINTSDAREKTPVGALTEAEIAWSRDLGAEIGNFQFLASVEEKGADLARRHIGMTVQRAIDLGEARGLDPFRYAFICFDAWEAQPGTPAVEGSDAVLDEDGNELEPAVQPLPEVPATPAGDRYGFRLDQLALFIARGQEARLAALEAALAD